MFKYSARLFLVLGLISMISQPSYARGFGGGGGGFHGFGGGGGGFHGFGGGGGGFHGFGGEGGGGFGGHESRPNFGGGFSGASGGGGGFSNHGNFSGQGFGHAGQSPNHSQLPTDGGFGNMSGNRTPQNFNKSGDFNGNTFNKTNEYNKNVNVNNVNASGYHPYGAGGYGYHPYGGYGYHPYGGYGYHPYGGYGYGYNPTAMMWTYAGISSLTSLTSFLGMSAIMGASGGGGSQKQPASYSNVTYNGGNVYIDGQPAGSSADFYKQAQQLASTSYGAAAAAPGAVEGAGAGYMGQVPAGGAYPSGGAVEQGSPDSASGDWKPLGTFSLSPTGQAQTGMMIQLEINKGGVLHGTYYNRLTMENAPVYGALDKATQRVSWTLGMNPSTVFDAGLGDLLKDESTILVHYDSTNTQHMTLTRLKEPPADMEQGQAQTQQG